MNPENRKEILKRLMKNFKKIIKKEIVGPLIISCCNGQYRIKRIKGGTKTIVHESIKLDPEDFIKIISGRLFVYRYIKVSHYKEIWIIRNTETGEKISIYKNEILDLKEISH